jgi:hypothetical protein
MSEIIADHPADRQILVILDNYCTHKKNETWLAAHPNVTFHFTPTSASWLPQQRHYVLSDSLRAADPRHCRGR